MRITESVWMIADNVPDKVLFAQEMGVRCDSVGWMKFELGRDKQLLRDIRRRADVQKASLRGAYEKTFSNVDTAWYILRPRIELGIDDTSYKKYNDITVQTIKAYKVPRGCHAVHFGSNWVAVSQYFVDTYEKLELSGLEFFWIPDTGKYDAQTFYYPVASSMAPRVAGELEVFRKKGYSWLVYDKEQIRNLYSQADSLGGNLLYLEDILDEIQFALIPLMVDDREMPDCDFAYLANWLNHCLLIRREAAQKLIQQKVIDENALVPVLSFDEKLHRDLITEGVKKEEKLTKVRTLLEDERCQLAQKNRPLFVPSEKITLQTLRKSKKMKEKRYQKGLKKADLSTLVGTLYEGMIPYYTISDGGEVSDTVAYYSYQQAQQETGRLSKVLAKDKELQHCVVIGSTANKDAVFLLEDNHKVIQFCLEKQDKIKVWHQVHEFFYDSIEV